MLNSLNSMAQSANLPATSRLLIAHHKGLSIRTTTVWAWKYGLSLQAIVTNAKASFSIGTLFCSAKHLAGEYTGFYTFSSSLIKAALIAASETAR